jgi:centromeric protein E
MRVTLEEERKALAAFVSKFDSLGLGLTLPPSSKLNLPMPTPGAAAAAFLERRGGRTVGNMKPAPSESLSSETSSPMRLDLHHTMFKAHPSLLEQMPEEEWSDVSFETGDPPEKTGGGGGKGPFIPRKGAQSPVREILGDKENIRP